MPVPPPPPRLLKSLSARLLALTVLFVMLAEVLIFAPSIGRFRLVWLEERLDDAHLAILAIEARPDGMVDADLQARLLAHAGTAGIELYRPDGSTLMLGPDMPKMADAVYDLRRAGTFDLIADALAVMPRGHDRLLQVIGHPAGEPAAVIEALVPEAPLRRAMLDYSQRILALSLFISAVTAALVYAALHRLLVRPLRRLTTSMLWFREAPEDQRRGLVPDKRDDEVGLAERALAEMQRDLRIALTQKARLAAVGAAVAKISHDLRAVLSSAAVVSERLEASADPEVRRLAPTVVKSLDRAVTMCSETLRYAREGPPRVALAQVGLAALVDEVAAEVGADHPAAWRNLVAAPLVVAADRELLFRILCNLGRNAAEAGAATITVSAAPTDGGCDIEIADDGPGLPAKALENLFRPFAGSTRAGGTGLGLVIARELATAQGGSLGLAATGREGTRFMLRLG